MGLTGFNLRRRRKASLLKADKKAEKTETSTGKNEDVKTSTGKGSKEASVQVEKVEEENSSDDLF